MDAFHWLLSLTIAYAVILVVALAAGLIAIARALLIARHNLAKVEAGLGQVEIQTKPLGDSLQIVNSVLLQTSGGLLVLLEHLRNADSHLGRVAEKLAARR